jgi:DNA (cytosine-5)-methyltransferase 1
MKNEIKYFSMFTGVGGFELGFEGASSNSKPSHANRKIKERRKGAVGKPGTLLHNRHCPSLRNRSFKCVGFAEIDKFACRVLKHKFPDIPNYGDVSKIDPQKLPDFDLLCGGFPCQAFSIAGKRRGFKDTRGTMFFEIARIVKAKRPKIVLLENVKGLLNHEKGQTYRVIVQALAELGYDVQWMVLNSKFFGVPQNRERVFLVASLGEKSRPQILPFGSGKAENSSLSGQQTNTVKTTQGPKSYVAECKQLPQTKGRHQGARVYKTSGVSQTLTSNGGGFGAGTGLYLDDLDKLKIRRLTPKECERLQGLPDGWTEFGIDEQGALVKNSDSQRYRQTGNAVTVNVIKAIAGNLKNAV